MKKIMSLIFLSGMIVAVHAAEISSGDMKLSWSYEGDKIEFVLSAPTTGWIALGVDPGKVMKDADFILAYVENGTVVISDQYGSGMISHKEDTEMGGTSDILEFSGDERNGVTTVRFVLPVKSGDKFDADYTKGKKHTLLFAYGPDGSDNFKKKHSYRGKLEAVF